MPLEVPDSLTEAESRLPTLSMISQLLKPEARFQKCLHALQAQNYSTDHAGSNSFEYF